MEGLNGKLEQQYEEKKKWGLNYNVSYVVCG